MLNSTVEIKPKRIWLESLAATRHCPWVPGERKEGGQGKEEGQVEGVDEEGWGEISQQTGSSMRAGTRLGSCLHSLASNWHIVYTQ